jgi:NADPH:quinone reductase-like Zn-dependent oxidoreductase
MNEARVNHNTACMVALMTWIGTSAHAAQLSVPTHQQAMVQTGSGGPATLKLENIPVPKPGDGQLLIRVYAASVNPADWAQLKQPGTVLGLDVSGVVAAVGPGVTDRPTGMPVFGMVDRTGTDGGYAHYALANATSTAPKPQSVSYAAAAGLGVVGVTALGALDEGQVHAGARVLITGAAGGVGSAAAQIALARGATVLGTASARHTTYLHRIGVNKIIDYTKGNIAGQAGMVNVVIDTVGGSEALEAFRALQPGGRFVSTARAAVTPEQCASAHVQCFGSPGHAASAPVSMLLQVAKLAGDGNLRIHVDRVYPLVQAAKALQYSHGGHAEGKIILAVTRQGGVH